jgi:hypothetical protein
VDLSAGPECSQACPKAFRPVKKPLTAEIAETAEKEPLRFLGVLCVLCGKTRPRATLVKRP